jgi:LuxR family maltose regulon positive regulatory protein
MDTPPSLLIQTKINIPVSRPGIVTRIRLLEQLHIPPDTNLSLVCAPAGYGKSTLLTEWAHLLTHSGTAVAWYSIDPSDNTSSSFGSYLVASFERTLGEDQGLAQASQLLRSSIEADLEKTLPIIINAVSGSGRECVLFLDDYHLIDAPEIHNSIAYLLEHLPPNLHIAIGSRNDPPLPLARLRARGQLHELRAQNLRFTREESILYLNKVMDLDLPLDLVNELDTRTEGWIVGLQLAAISLANCQDKADFISHFTGEYRYLVDYLMEEVVNRQSDEVKDFLLSTCHLERMCVPLCDAILEKQTSESILKQLEKSNIFILPLDEQATWYRYHHLFRDFLQKQLKKKDPDRATWQHRLASEWFSTHGYLSEAVQHALQTQDWDFAASMIEEHSFTMMLHSEISTIAEWCHALPNETIQKSPLLCIMLSWTLVLTFKRQNREKAEALLHRAEEILSYLEDKVNARMLADQIAVIRTYLPLAPDPAIDPEGQLSLSQEMLASTSEGETSRFPILLARAYAQMALQDAGAARKTLEEARRLAHQGQLFFGVIESTFHLIRLAQFQGNLHLAENNHRQVGEDLSELLEHPEKELPALGCLDIALGCFYLDQNRLDDAEKYLLHGLTLSGWGMIPFYLMLACLALSRLYRIHGQPGKANEYLTRLGNTWPDTIFCIQSVQLTDEIRDKPTDPAVLARATTWCEEFMTVMRDIARLPGIGPLGVTEAYYVAYLNWVRMQIMLNKPDETLAYLEQQLQLAKMNGLVALTVDLNLLLAQARQAEGDIPRAMSALRLSLEAAESIGYIRCFDQGPSLNRLLHLAVEQGLFTTYTQKILNIIKHTQPTLGSTTLSAKQAISLETGEHLSQREIDVIHLLAQGATNREIAGRLFITVGTVKSHINHILVKLGARNRTEAVALARRSRILDH